MSVEITPAQMYYALSKAAVDVKETERIKCPYYRMYVSTSKGDNENMCERGEIAVKCEWPYGCPLISKESK